VTEKSEMERGVAVVVDCEGCKVEIETMGCVKGCDVAIKICEAIGLAVIEISGEMRC
jgi:hypothetical protein